MIVTILFSYKYERIDGEMLILHLWNDVIKGCDRGTRATNIRKIIDPTIRELECSQDNKNTEMNRLLNREKRKNRKSRCRLLFFPFHQYQIWKSPPLNRKFSSWDFFFFFLLDEYKVYVLPVNLNWIQKTSDLDQIFKIGSLGGCVSVGVCVCVYKAGINDKYFTEKKYYLRICYPEYQTAIWKTWKEFHFTTNWNKIVFILLSSLFGFLVSIFISVFHWMREGCFS